MGLIIVFVLLAAGTALALRDMRAALLTGVFVAPWNGLQADFGVTVYAVQLVMLPLAAVALIKSLDKRIVAVPAGLLLGVFAVYAITVSLIMVGFLPPAELSGGVLRGPTGRALTQIVFFLFTLSPAIVVPMVARREDIAACGRIFIASALVLAVIGWGQIAVWYATGSNPIQISAISAALGGNEVYSHQGEFAFSALSIYRMNSFGGEPRQLGVIFVIAMLILQLWAITAPSPRRWLLALWLFFLVSTLATYSTTAAALWPIGSAALLPALLLTRTPARRSMRVILAAVVVAAAPIAAGIAVAEARGVPVVELISERTIDRIDENGAIEDYDLAILDYLKADPNASIAGKGIGNIHLYAAPYVDPLFAIYAEGNVFSAKSGYLRFIAEIGIIGLTLFLLWYADLLRRSVPALRNDVAIATLAPFALVMLGFYLLRADLATMFWLTAGLVGAGANLGAQPLRSRAVAPRLA